MNRFQRYSFNPQTAQILRQRLESRLESATPEVRQYIFNALGVRVLVRADKTWELELEIPREVPQPERVLQIANSRPELNSDWNTA